MAEQGKAAVFLGPGKGYEIREFDIPDPEPGCQEDWIAPVRVRGRAEGRPEWGVFERYENGAWVAITKGEIDGST